MKTEPEIRQALREWVLKNSSKIETNELNDNTPLIEQRIIKSVQIMDLILFIEKLRDRSIEVDSLKPGTFRNIDAIYNNFFAGDDNGHRTANS